MYITNRYGELGIFRILIILTISYFYAFSSGISLIIQTPATGTSRKMGPSQNCIYLNNNLLNIYVKLHSEMEVLIGSFKTGFYIFSIYQYSGLLNKTCYYIVYIIHVLIIYYHNVTKYDDNFSEVKVYTNKTLTHSYSLLYTIVEPNHRIGKSLSNQYFQIEWGQKCVS